MAVKALETMHQRLASPREFVRRLAWSALAGFAFISISLFAGMLGYHFFESMDWLDAFLNAAMILSGMGPLAGPVSVGGKLFAGLYALYSGFAVLIGAAIIFTPVIHRGLHRFHLEYADEDAAAEQQATAKKPQSSTGAKSRKSASAGGNARR